MADENGNWLGDVIRGAVILAGAYVVQGALTRGAQAKPQGVPTPLKQPIPPKWSGFGECRRFNPPYACFELSEGTLPGAGVIVTLAHDGEMEAWTEFWLHDDIGFTSTASPTTEKFGLTSDGWVRRRIGSNGRYGVNPEAVMLRSTLGTAGQTAITQVVNQFPASHAWTSNHRCRGIALQAMIARRGNASGFATRYPFGLPLLTGTGKWQKYWDMRDGTQTRTTASSHKWGRNLALQTLHFLTQARGGMNLDYDRLINIDSFEDAADICDETVSLKAGGTEPRYPGGGGYYHDAPYSETLGQMLRAMDGRLLFDAAGKLCLFAGKWVEPDIVLTDRDIILEGTSLTRFLPEDQRINELAGEYTAKANRWQMSPVPAWRDEADIAATTVRSATWSAPWCQSPAHLQRLLKRRFLKLNAALRGNLRVNMYGYKALGKPTVRLQAPRLAEMLDMEELEDCRFQVEYAEPDLASLSADLNVIAAPAPVAGVSPWDAWNAALEEATPGVARVRVPEVTVAPPLIAAATITTTGGVVRVLVVVNVPSPVQADEDLTWFLRWRVTSPATGPWSNELRYTEVPAGPTVSLTFELPQIGDVEIQVAYRTGGQRSEWSAGYGTNAPVPSGPFTDGQVLVDAQTPGEIAAIEITDDGHLEILALAAGATACDDLEVLDEKKVPTDVIPAKGAGGGEQGVLTIDCEAGDVITGYVGDGFGPSGTAGGETSVTTNSLTNPFTVVCEGGTPGTVDEEGATAGLGGDNAAGDGTYTPGNDGGGSATTDGGGSGAGEGNQTSPGGNGLGPGGGGAAPGGKGRHGGIRIVWRSGAAPP